MGTSVRRTHRAGGGELGVRRCRRLQQPPVPVFVHGGVVVDVVDVDRHDVICTLLLLLLLPAPRRQRALSRVPLHELLERYLAAAVAVDHLHRRLHPFRGGVDRRVIDQRLEHLRLERLRAVLLDDPRRARVSRRPELVQEALELVAVYHAVAVGVEPGGRARRKGGAVGQSRVVPVKGNVR
eukprot:30880-Pelagococcus_subviridis.AAC.3